MQGYPPSWEGSWRQCHCFHVVKCGESQNLETRRCRALPAGLGLCCRSGIFHTSSSFRFGESDSRAGILTGLKPEKRGTKRCPSSSGFRCLLCAYGLGSKALSTRCTPVPETKGAIPSTRLYLAEVSRALTQRACPSIFNTGASPTQPLAGTQSHPNGSPNPCWVPRPSCPHLPSYEALSRYPQDWAAGVGSEVQGQRSTGELLPSRRPPYYPWLRVMVASFPWQVTEEVHRLLKRCSYQFVCRGKVSVKGKGEMLTYFLEGRTDGNSSHGRTFRLERRMCPYGRGGGQARRPPLCPAAGPLVRPGLPPAPTSQYLSSTAAGKEA